MAGETRATGTSLTSFQEAAEIAFDQVPGDPDLEGMASAEIVRAWMSKGGITPPQFHVDISWPVKKE